MITIKEFSKIDLRIGEVKETDKEKIKVNIGNQDLTTNSRVAVNKGDKIVVAIQNNQLIIPTINKTIPIAPEKDTPAGTKIS